MKKLLITALMLCFVSADEFFEPKTTIGGYGELHYDMEANDGDGKLDFHRFIIFYKHQFSPEWSMMSEVEIEHNMVYSSSGSDDGGGYLAMEQAHLDYWNGTWGWQGGVILVPAGITNEYHEPPTFMSVERPEYNKYIIPSTWFENGFSFYGNMGNVNWNFTMTGDMLGNKIGSSNQALRKARLKGFESTTTDWTKTLQLSWTGMEGLKVGGSVTMNDAPVWALDDDGEYDYKDQTGTAGFTLTEVNATYSKNNMYARFENGNISYDGVAGLESSSGYYLDLGYDIADLVGCDDSNMYVWTRTSAYNTTDTGNDTEISLFGLTYKPANNVSIKFENPDAVNQFENNYVNIISDLKESLVFKENNFVGVCAYTYEKEAASTEM